MKKWFLPIVLLCFAVSGLQAQVQKIFHQAFELGDSIQTIRFDLVGEYQTQLWAGNNILVEMQVKLFNASEGILDFLLEKEERYAIEPQHRGAVLLLRAKDQKRQNIKNHKTGSDVFEEVQVRIYIPDRFEEGGDGTWRLPNGESSGH